MWLSWLVLLLGGLVVGSRDGHGSTWAVAGRMGSSLALVCAGWLAYHAWRTSGMGRFVTCVAVGITLGTIGDFFNAGLLKLIPLPDPVLGGIAAFGLGHVAYMMGCLDLARRAALDDRRAMLRAVIAWQLIGLVGWYFVALEGTLARAIVWPALPYSLLLAGTAGITSGLAWQNRRLFPLALGGGLFLASDLLLAFELFRGTFPHQTECVWLTYGPAQMLIVFSTLIAIQLPAAPRRVLGTV